MPDKKPEFIIDIEEAPPVDIDRSAHRNVVKKKIDTPAIPAKAKNHHIARNTLIFFLLVIVGGLAYSYFFIINPTFVDKPVIEKPYVPVIEAAGDSAQLAGQENTTNSTPEEIAENFDVEPEHVEYLLNEIDAYKLHDAPLDKEPPVMEVKLTDEDTYFEVIVQDNHVESYERRATDPDIRIFGSKLTILELLNEPNILDSIGDYANSGRVWVEPLKDETTLASKGYLAIYDSIT